MQSVHHVIGILLDIHQDGLDPFAGGQVLEGLSQDLHSTPSVVARFAVVGDDEAECLECC